MSRSIAPKREHNSKNWSPKFEPNVVRNNKHTMHTVRSTTREQKQNPNNTGQNQ